MGFAAARPRLIPKWAATAFSIASTRATASSTCTTAARRATGKRSIRLVRPASRKSQIASAVAILLAVVLIVVAIPEALGDRPYDPRPSRVSHELLPV